jgi:hypothetical protein
MSVRQPPASAQPLAGGAGGRPSNRSTGAGKKCAGISGSAPACRLVIEALRGRLASFEGQRDSALAADAEYGDR